MVSIQDSRSARGLAHFARVGISSRPEAMQLRYLGTLNTIANERSSTIVFPFPVDFGKLLGAMQKTAE